MKLIVRADDVGYSKVNNIGAFEAIERGVVTSADVMLESPGTVDALEKLKDFPWISVGWHTHFWGAPVLDTSEVPSLIIKETGRFRHDIQTAEDLVYDELLDECRTQVERCAKILGRVPDVGGGHGNSIFARVLNQVSEEYGIATNYVGWKSLYETPFTKGLKAAPKADEKWIHRKIFMANPAHSFEALFTDSITELEKYDPASYYLNDPTGLLDFAKDEYVVTPWHPGYVDHYVYRQGDHGNFARNFILARIMDAEMLYSDRLKEWIINNKVELSNFRDALFGSKEYQNHLKAVGSSLAV